VQVTGELSATAALNRFRATFYLLLARSFSRELDGEALSGLGKVSAALIEAADLLVDPPQPDFQTGRELLRTFFGGVREDDPGVIEELSRCYASLFLGVGPATVSPCESSYRGESPLLFQSAHFEVQQAYREIGLAKNQSFREPEDHIAVELSYMARLSELMQEATEGESERSGHYLKMQRDFLENHLMQWVPVFTRDLLDATRSPFYRAMAHLLKGYIHIDTGLIRSMMEELGTQNRPQ
jgi:putative dimethyl sulfoxide reductase chaperone